MSKSVSPSRRLERTWREHGASKRALHYGITSLQHGITSLQHGITSLQPETGPPERLLALKRGRWAIANGLHRVKDVILGADQSTIHQGQGPTVMALLRQAAVSLLHRAGIRQISARLRHHSRHPAAAVALLLAPHPPDAQALGQALWAIYKPIVRWYSISGPIGAYQPRPHCPVF